MTDAGALPAVRVHVGGADFYLLAEDGPADGLAARIEALRSSSGGALRLRPRTAPDDAPWAAHTDRGEAPDALSGDEDPGTSWRDVPGADIAEVETVRLHGPTALWHWAIDEQPPPIRS
ncbi:hypothetical protein [Jatrophihabitans fulvus]